MNLLVIDDNDEVLETLEIILDGEFDGMKFINHPKSALSLLREWPADLILLDMNFEVGINTGNEGLFWLNSILDQYPETVIILMTAFANVDLAVRALKRGAFDFITKPWENHRLLATLEAGKKLAGSKNQIRDLKEKNKALTNDIDKEIFFGISERMKLLYENLLTVSQTDANILLTGENGTGKTLFAREIHKNSVRCSESFMSVDMPSLSETVFESELFGHKKGAFTDAKENRIGRFKATDGGTLFLDELGDLPSNQQTKLLSALHNRAITPLGSNVAEEINIRLITATNRNLEQLVKEGKFRQDLFYRINTIVFNIPPLRERREDIPAFIEYFLEKHKKKYHKDVAISEAELKRFSAYSWPGNIRELEHTIERGVILSNSGWIRFDNTEVNEIPNKNETPLSLAEIEKEGNSTGPKNTKRKYK